MVVMKQMMIAPKDLESRQIRATLTQINLPTTDEAKSPVSSMTVQEKTPIYRN
jgi:hypothetical protein